MSPPSPYRELTAGSVTFGVAVGVVLNAALTYAALKFGVLAFSAASVAALAGAGVLRACFAQGSVLECGIAQTTASAIAAPSAAIAFTLPVLFVLGVDLAVGSETAWCVALASVAGAVLGCAFIIPLRARMMDIQRLQFPMGNAAGAILRAPCLPGSMRAMLVGVLVGAAIYFPVISPTIRFTTPGPDGSPQPQRVLGYGDLAPAGVEQGTAWVTNQHVDLGGLIRSAAGSAAPGGLLLMISISPLAVGAGYIAGRRGWLIAFGGLLTCCVLLPASHAVGQTPPWLSGNEAGLYGHTHWNQPIGLGLLIGGAVISAWNAAPLLFRSIRAPRLQESLSAHIRKRDELPWGVLAASVSLGMICLYAAVFYLQQAQPHAQQGLLSWVGLTNPYLRAAAVTLIGGAWIWFAGLAATEVQGRTGVSPIAGVAVVTVSLLMLLTGLQDVASAVVISAALCVAISCAGDLMQNQRVGAAIGATPARQQTVQLFASTVAPIVSMLVLYVIITTNQSVYGAPLGDGTATEAPQAQVMRDVIMDAHGPRAAPMAFYGIGAAMGALLSAVSLPGLGVFAGLALYLPTDFLLAFGLGCAAREAARRFKGVRWAESTGGLFAAGLVVGESVTALAVRFVAVMGEVLAHG